ncbi:MAG: hypothetical protein CSA23_03445 [Deltaproteobacteria bacterium]|nr:MAG: hypothetical protein CSA23_03445 [Deltaproteobacteria bacterium]
MWFLIFLALTIYVFSLVDLDSEYWGPFALPRRIGLWHLHQDEKLIVPDARRLYLGDAAKGGWADFEPPNSAVFGPGSHMLAALGFRLFGFGNLGFRFFSATAAALFNMLMLLLLSTTAPGPPGVFWGLLFILSYPNFCISRHALVENYLHLIVALILVGLFVFPEVSQKHLWMLALLGSASVCFKTNFPVYCWLVLLASLLAKNSGLGPILEMSAWYAVWLAVFEALNYVLLSRLGSIGWRYRIIGRAFREFTGKARTPLNTRFHPARRIIFAQFAAMLAEHLIFFKGLGDKWNTSLRGWLSGGLLVLLAFAVLLTGIDRANELVGACALSTLLLLMACAPFNFAFKRAILPLHLMWIMLAGLLYAVLPAEFIDSTFGLFLASALLAASLLNQVRMMKIVPRLRSQSVMVMSAELEKMLGENSVRAHCYACRFSWRNKTSRIVSCDDSAGDNLYAITEAVRNGDDFVLLSGRGGFINAENPLIRKMAPAGVFSTGEADSDEADTYLLFRIADQTDTIAAKKALKAAGILHPPPFEEIDIARLIAAATAGCDNPTVLRTAYNTASHMKVHGQEDAARRIFKALLPTGFNPSGVNLHLGELSLRVHETTAARAYLLNCLDFDPTHERASMLLGKVPPC